MRGRGSLQPLKSHDTPRLCSEDGNNLCILHIYSFAYNFDSIDLKEVRRDRALALAMETEEEEEEETPRPLV